MRRELIPLFVVVGATVAGAHATRPMATYRALALGANLFEVGMITSAFSAFPILFAVGMGRWIDRIGEQRVLSLGCVAMIVGGIAGVTSDSLAILGISQLAMGLGMVSTALASQGLIASGSSGGRVGRFGWYGGVTALGHMLGPAIAAAAVVAFAAPVGQSSGGPANAEAPAFMAVVFAAILALVVTVRYLAPADRERVRRGAEDRLLPAVLAVVRRRGMSRALFVAVAITIPVDVLIAYLPAVASAASIDITTVGALLSVRAFASFVSRLLVVRLVVPIGARRLLACGSAVASAAILGLAFPVSIPMYFVLSALIGAGLGVGQPMTLAWIVDAADPKDQGVALGVRLTTYSASLLVVPTLMGAMAATAGFGAIWVTLAAVVVFAAVLAWRTGFDANWPRPVG